MPCEFGGHLWTPTNPEIDLKRMSQWQSCMRRDRPAALVDGRISADEISESVPQLV